MLGDISRALRPAHPTSKSTDHKRWDTEIRMYAGVIRSAVHTRFRRGVTIAVVHSGFKPDKACLRGVEKMRPVTTWMKPDKTDGEATGVCSHRTFRGGWGQRAWKDRPRSLGGPVVRKRKRPARRGNT